MKKQKVLVILKPDCLERQLEDLVLSRIEAVDLKILHQERRFLSENEIRQIYEEYSQSDTFQALVSYMLSGQCLILLLEGPDAVRLVNQLKGRTGSGKGIRGELAENYIRNIMHSAETEFKTSKEIRIFFKEAQIIMQPNKVILGLSGMSECGKSSAGLYFDARGVKRLKIAQILDLVRIEHDSGCSLKEFVDRAIRDKPDWLRMAFADKLLDEMDRLGIRCCSLESMGDPEMVRYLRSRFPGEFFSVYIDAAQDKRLEHQMIREGLSDVEAAKSILIPKDEFKVKFWRMPDIMAIADVVVDNNGTLEGFQQQLEAILDKYAR